MTTKIGLFVDAGLSESDVDDLRDVLVDGAVRDDSILDFRREGA